VLVQLLAAVAFGVDLGPPLIEALVACPVEVQLCDPGAAVNYLTEIGNAIKRELDPDLLPEGDTDTLFRLYAVLALAKGFAVTVEGMHNAWADWMSESDPNHDAVRPYDALKLNVRREDWPFVVAIRNVSSRFQDRGSDV